MPQRSALLARAALAVLALLFFWRLALTNQIMVGVDIFTYFYPYRSAVNEALNQWRLPLWNPYLFMGVPLLANGQAGVFYPFNWIFAGLSAPLAINASIILHIILAALFFHVFARDVLRLTEPAAFIAACVYTFSGYVGSLVEHVNQLQAAAWFPLLLYCADRARRGARGKYVLLGGVVFALQLLAGHAQVSFISVAGMGFWMLGSQTWGSVGPLRPARAALRRLLPVLRNFSIDLAAIGGMCAVAAGLAAVQLLPMVELARLSIRAAGMTYREAVAFSLPPQRLLESLLPTFGAGEAVFSEYIGFIGVAALLLALIGLVARARQYSGLLLLLCGGIALALGLYDPLYYLLYKLVPGFGLFRVPARWLFLAVFSAAGFAGIGAQSVIQGWTPRWKRVNRIVMVTVVALALTGIALLAAMHVLGAPPWPVPAIWAGVALTTLYVMHTAGRSGGRFAHNPRARERGVGIALSVLVVVELFAATRWLPYNQLTAPEAWSSLRPAVAFLLSDDSKQPFRFLSYSDLTWDPGDLKDTEAMFAGQLSARAIYEYTVAAKAKEIVAPNLAMRYHLESVDGYDGGVLPLARFVGLQSLFLSPEQINPDGRLRERVRAAPAARWLDLFNVRYLIADKVFDVWVDGIYYDLGMGLELPAADRSSHPIDVPADFTATALGVISYLTGAAALPNDTPVAELLATDAYGEVHKFILRAGHETAESEYDLAPVAHAKARAVHTLRDQPQANEYHAFFTFDTPARITALSVRALQPAGLFALRGMTLVGAESGAGKPLTFAPDGKYRLAQSGDVKIYEREDPSPRALVIHHAAIIAGDSEALRVMSGVNFDPRTQVLIAGGKELNDPSPSTAATVTMNEDEHVIFRTDDSAEGYLLIKDTWYPGWTAWVDGQPATIERADTYFRAVHLDPGSHSVELRFEPETLKIGSVLSLAAAVLCAGAAAWLGLRSRTPGRPP
jgi:Bacterial membrane protein YfhO